MPTLHITRGLPGSGKTTHARAWVAENPTTRARINRDDLRAMLHNSTHIRGSNGQRGTEQAIIAARDAAIVALLSQGLDVICDDTNLPALTVAQLRRLAGRARARFEVIDLTGVPVEVCVARDAARSGRARVGEQVIWGMHDAHIAEAEHAA